MVALHIGKQRGFQGGVGELVNAQRAEQRVGAHTRDQIGAAADQSGLRSAQQFVAAVGHDVHAGAQAVEHAGLAADAEILQIDERAAAQIFHQRYAALARERDQFGSRCLLGKSGNFKIGSMHAQQQPRALGNRFFVVGDAGAIGRAHFAQSCARLRHDIRDAERTADLDQFAARDDHFAAFGQGVERQQNCGGIVVHDDGVESQGAPPAFAQAKLRKRRST